ncbi:MAG: potassium channel family protein [Deltaproteobacteria bacterium]
MYVIVVGCGRVGGQVATLLSTEGHNVVVIDKDAAAFKRLGRAFNGATLVGNGYELDVLKEAGVEKADVLCSLTDGDNTNIMTSQVARKIFRVPRVIARVYDSARAHIYESLGLEVLSGTILFAAMIRDKLIDKRLSSFVIETGGLGILELDVPEALAGRTVAEAALPDAFRVIAVLRSVDGERKRLLPSDATRLERGDRVYGIVRTDRIPQVKKLFQVKDDEERR